MPLPLRLFPEFCEGTCEVCGTLGPVKRFYAEAGDCRGDTPWLCTTCDWNPDNPPTHVELEDPPKVTGARPPSRRLRKAVDKQELETARLIGGRKQKASGAMLHAKGDVRRAGVLRGENKATTKKSITVKLDVLDKISSECVGTERPFVHIRFLHPVTLAPLQDWVLIPVEDWKLKDALTDDP